MGDYRWGTLGTTFVQRPAATIAISALVAAAFVFEQALEGVATLLVRRREPA